MGLDRIREQINLWLYDSKVNVLRLLRILNLLVSITAIGTLIYIYGFEHTDSEKENLVGIIKMSFGFYIIQFVFRFLYDFKPREFIKRNWFEGIMMLFLLVEGISYNFFDTLLLHELFKTMGIQSFEDVSTFFIQAYFLVVVFLELRRNSNILPNFKLHPAIVFVASFALIILAGAGLLMLPEMVPKGQESLGFTDALFMSTSATCVTGLGVIDIATELSYKGHVVILILIKLGGLNIIAFGFLFILMHKIGLGVKQDSLIEDFVNKDAVHGTRNMLRKIVIWSVVIELVGAIFLFLLWSPEAQEHHFGSVGDRIFDSVFHSVSAFNNAGLSTFSGGLYNEYVQGNYLVHLMITIIVFFGALGFAAIFDLFDIRNLRERLRHPWKQINFSTKIALYISLILVVFGTVTYYVLEYNNTLKGMNFGEAFITSLFQSVTRTSGFNSVNFDATATNAGPAIGIPFLLIMLFLMFVGSSSSSTGGGIKTSTFALIWASFTQTIRGKKHPEIFKRTISLELIGKAFAVLLIFIAGNLIGIIFLSITETQILAQEGRSIMDLVFEEVSAFGTVGLSTGITGDLSVAGKYIIVFSMFIGRVGTLTVAYFFGRKLLSRNYKYPSGHTMVG